MRSGAEPSLECLPPRVVSSFQHLAATDYKLVLLFPEDEPRRLCFTEDTWGEGEKTPHMPFLALALADSRDGFRSQIDHFFLLLINQGCFEMLFSLSLLFITSSTAVIVVTFFSPHLCIISSPVCFSSHQAVRIEVASLCLQS